MSNHPTPVRLTGFQIAVNPDGSVTHGVYSDPPPAAPSAVPPRPMSAESTTGSRILDGYLDLAPPNTLYHYTSADGLIGILKSREIWASNVAFLNDTKESINATDCIGHALSNRLLQPDLTESEKSFLASSRSTFGRFTRQFYVASLSKERDLLSQWRAYCPPLGGYAIGLPVAQLTAIANDQAFLLAPCIYDYDAQYQIGLELIEQLLMSFRSSQDQQDRERNPLEQLLEKFALVVARYGLLLKHSSFSEEGEWRLISPMLPFNNPRLDFRSVSSRPTPFYRFPLATERYPDFLRIDQDRLTVVVGPSSHSETSCLGVQFLLFKYATGGAFTASRIPYRA